MLKEHLLQVKWVSFRSQKSIC